jgi:hypothetical protein
LNAANRLRSRSESVLAEYGYSGRAGAVRDQSTVRRQPDWNHADTQSREWSDVDPHDDDLFVDGDVRRRERLLSSIGSVKPEPRDDDLPRFVRDKPDSRAAVRGKEAVAAPRESDAAPRRATPAWVFALLGFIVGIGFWHAIGFWGFISQIVLPPARTAQAPSSMEVPAAWQSTNTPNYQPARPTRAKP